MVESAKKREDQAVAESRPKAVKTPRATVLLFEERLGELELATGNYDAASEAFRSARDERQRLRGLTRSDECRYLLRVANLALKIGDYREALDYCDQGVRVVDDPFLAASLQALAGLICCSEGRFDDAEHRVAIGLTTISGSPLSGSQEKRAYGSLLRTRGNVLLGKGRPDEAVAIFEESLDLWQELGDRWEHSITLFNLGDAYAQAGDYDTALRFLEEAEKAKIGIKDPWGLAYTHLVRGQILLDRRRWSRARAEADAGLKLAEEIGDPKITALLQILTARVLAAQGEREEAETILESALGAAQQAAADPEVLQAKLALASSLRQRGDIGRARHQAEEALALASKSPSKLSIAAAALELGRIEALQGDVIGAKAHLDRALELADEVGNPFRKMEVISAQVELGLA